MGYIYRREVPIYIQLIDIIKIKIIDGSYLAGDRLPSIRDMAIEYEVTPNTIQRALNIFEEEGIILTERTNGKYITSDLNKIRKLRSNHLQQSMHSMIEGLLNSGYTWSEINMVFQKEMKADEEDN